MRVFLPPLPAFGEDPFRKGKSPCQGKDATSIQIHAAIASDHHMQLLKLTGHNKVWAAPKAEDGRLTDEYRVLWLAAHVDAQKAAAFTAKIGGAAGLVRGSHPWASCHIQHV